MKYTDLDLNDPDIRYVMAEQYAKANGLDFEDEDVRAVIDENLGSLYGSDTAPAKQEEPHGLWKAAREVGTDTALDLATGVVDLGQQAVGAADIVTGNLVGRGLDAVGYDPKRTKEFIASGYSPERVASEQQLAESQKEGLLAYGSELLTNPRALAGRILQSAPASLAGAGAARMVAGKMLTAALAEEGIAAGTAEAASFAAKFFADPKVKATLTAVGATTEGVQSAGGIQEAGREEGKDWSETVLPAVAGGIGTGAIGALSSKLLPDAEATIATAGMGAKALGKDMLESGKEIAKSMFKEGWLEEMPQSAQEQVFQNLATGKPWSEGVPQAALEGGIVGMAQGGVMTTASETINKAFDRIGKAESIDEAINAAQEALDVDESSAAADIDAATQATEEWTPDAQADLLKTAEQITAEEEDAEGLREDAGQVPAGGLAGSSSQAEGGQDLQRQSETGAETGDQEEQVAKPTYSVKETDTHYAIHDDTGENEPVMIEKTDRELTPEQREVERKFALEVGSDLPGAIEKYKAHPDSKGGKILNPDIARDLSTDYGASNDARSTHAASTHETASMLTKRMFEQRLADESIEGDTVVAMAGGGGSGKTTAVEGIPNTAQALEQAHTVLDATFANLKSSRAKIEQVLAAGKKMKVIFVGRNVRDAFMNGVIPRAEKGGRTVALDRVAADHMAAAENVAILSKEYRNNPNVDFVFVDNNHGKGEAKETTIDILKNLDYSIDEKEVEDELERRVVQGTLSEAGRRGLRHSKRGGPRTEEVRGQADARTAEKPEQKRQPDQVAKGGKFTADRIKKQLPFAKNVETVEDGHIVTFENGTRLKVATNQDIEIDLASASEAYRQKFQKGEVYAAGSWQRVGNLKGLVRLDFRAELSDLHHEIFHAAFEMALTPLERKALLKKYGTEERAAKAYGEYAATGKGPTTFQKITDFLKALFGLTTKAERIADKTIEELRQGKVWERPASADYTDLTGGISPEEMVSYSIKNRPRFIKETLAFFRTILSDNYAANEPGRKQKIEAAAEAEMHKLLSSLGPDYESYISQMEESSDFYPMMDEGKLPKNADPTYVTTVDLVGACVRMLRTLAIHKHVKDNGVNFTPLQYRALEVELNSKGFDLTCLYCYAFTRRAKGIEKADFMRRALVDGVMPDKDSAGNEWNEKQAPLWAPALKEAKENPEWEKEFSALPQIMQLVTSQKKGWLKKTSTKADEFAKKYPAIWALKQGVTHPGNVKTVGLSVGMAGQILKLDKDVVDGLRNWGGLRWQSSVDFIPMFTYDYVQGVVEMAMRNLPGHVYTKEMPLVRLLKDSGMKINLSAAPLVRAGKVWWEGKGKDRRPKLDKAIGSLSEAEVEEALRISGGHAGVMMLGVNDEVLDWAFDSTHPWAQYCIPYHASGMPTSIRQHFIGSKSVVGAVDYTDPHEGIKLYDSEAQVPAEYRGLLIPQITKSGKKTGKTLIDYGRITEVHPELGWVEKAFVDATTAARSANGAAKDTTPTSLLLPPGEIIDQVNGTPDDIATQKYFEVVERLNLHPMFHDYLSKREGRGLSAKPEFFWRAKKHYARTDTPFTAPDPTKIDYDYAKKLDKEWANDPMAQAVKDGSSTVIDAYRNAKVTKEKAAQIDAAVAKVQAMGDNPIGGVLASFPALKEKYSIKKQEGSGSTQVATTVSMYRKAVNKMMELVPGAKSVLDYGAGLGLGSDAMREEAPGVQVDSYEVNPERWKGAQPPTYTDSDQIKKKYDVIVNANVLNVLEPELRAIVLKDIGDKLAPGGKAIVTTRGWANDINTNKNFRMADEEKAMWVIKGDQEVYQKGYDGNELVEYAKDVLGDGFSVTKINGFGKAGVVVTKGSEKYSLKTTKDEFKPVDTNSGNFKRWFKNSKVVDEDGKPLVVFHATTHDFEEFKKTLANPENDMGKGFYFTTATADASENYAGEGPDLTQRIEMAMARIKDDIYNSPEEFGLSEDEAEDDDAVEKKAYELARKQLKGPHEGAIMPAYLSFQNPVILGGKDATELTYEAEYDEETEEYGEPAGTLVDFAEALRNILEERSTLMPQQIDEIGWRLFEDGESISAEDVINRLRTTDMAYAEDTEGDYALSGNEFIRQAFEDAGFDGIIDRTVDIKFGSQKRIGQKMAGMAKDTVHYIAFKSTTIKSAVSNTGEFSETDPRIRYSIRQQTAQLPDETKVEYIQRRFQDKWNRFRVITDWLKEKGVNLSAMANVTRKLTNRDGRVVQQLEDFMRFQIEPLVKEAAKMKISIEEIADYLLMVHTPEANARQRKIHKNPDATAAGVKDDEAEAKVRQYEARPDFRKFKAIAEKFQKMSKETADSLVKAGLVHPDSQAAWEAAYQNYVPLKGGEEDTAAKTGTGKGLRGGVRSKLRTGHTLRDEHVIDNIIKAREQAIKAIEDNNVKLSILQFIIEANDATIGTIAKPVKWTMAQIDSMIPGVAGTDVVTGLPGKKTVVQKKVEVVYYNGSPSGVFGSSKQADEFINREIARGAHRDKFHVVVSSDPAVKWITKPMLEEGELDVYVQGHMIRIKLNDELLARAATNMGEEYVNGILAVGRDLNRFLSRAYTGYSPEFAIKNIARDFTAGMINIVGDEGLKVVPKVVANYGFALKELMKARKDSRLSPMLTRYRKAGGSTGAAWLGDLDKIATNVETIFRDAIGSVETYKKVYAEEIAAKSSPMKARIKALAASGVSGFHKIPGIGDFLTLVERINGVSENAFRLATFKTMVDMGKTDAEAGEAAKNVTLNFNKRGELGAQMGSLYLFFNPAVQGIHRGLVAVGKSEHKHEAQALVGMLALSGFALAQLARSGGDDDEENWGRIGQSTKDRNLIFSLGGKRYVTIPMPYEYSAAVGVGYALSDVLHGKDPQKVAFGLASSIIDAFSPLGNPLLESGNVSALQMAPTLGKMLMGPTMNESGFGQPIMPESYSQFKPDSQLMWKNTRGSWADYVAKTMNEYTGGTAHRPGALDVSPETLKFWVQGLTGGAGNFLQKSLNLPLVMAQGTLPEEKELPFVGVVTRELSVMDTRREFWQAANEAKAAAAEISSIKSAKDKAAMADITDADKRLANLAKFATKSAEIAKAKRDAIFAVNNDDKLSLSAKREQIKKIEEQEEAVYQKFLDKFKK